MKKTNVRSRYSRALIVPLVLTVGMVLTVLTVSSSYAGTKEAKAVKEFGPEWYLQPSSSGDLSARNVIVTKSSSAFGDVYIARVRFTNTDNLSVNNASESVIPDSIFIFGFVAAEQSIPPNVGYQAEYVYALPIDPKSGNPSGAWESAQGVELNEDFCDNPGCDDLFNDNNNSWDYTLTYSSNPLTASQMTHQVEIYRDAANEILVANNFSGVISIYPHPLVIGPPLNKIFDNVAVETHGSYGLHGGNVRFLAQGVGPVQLFNDITFDDPVYNNQRRADAIYYRIDGVVVGDLTGTPFDGGASAGLWFE